MTPTLLRSAAAKARRRATIAWAMLARGTPVTIAVALVLMGVAACGCASGSPVESSGNFTARVVATQDFGHQVMFDKTVSVPPGTSAMDALHLVAEVGSSYGGGFVDSIDGVSSRYGTGVKQDWFVSVNGIMTNVGALDYVLRDGDVEHWDFHGWTFRMFVPATVGDFPEPFIHGYGGNTYPTVVVYADGFEDEASALGDRLSQLGLADLSTQHVSGLDEADRQNSNLIVIGGTECNLVAEMNQVWNRLGFFVHFEDGSMVAYDATANVDATYGPGCGVIQATQSPWNPKGVGACENVVWMVSGTDEAGVASAADAFINRYDQLQYACAVVVIDGHISKVPPP
ncbi:MAG: DUF4430 domain-containing protein [Chloroflexota bacterium]|nr:DUF4430 domain-containing protein [Chloroflexota bacterium]